MCNDEFAVNDAIRLELALDAYRFIRMQDHVCRKVEATLGDVQDFTETGRVIFRHQAAP